MVSYAPADRGSDLLYSVLQQHLASFLDRAESDGVAIPAYAKEELTDDLACGIVEHGFTLWRCKDCGTARAVAFSCKHRGFCPSCCGRRMNQTAANLVDRVFPHVPIRQCGSALSWPLRLPLRPTGRLALGRRVGRWRREIARAGARAILRGAPEPTGLTGA